MSGVVFDHTLTEKSRTMEMRHIPAGHRLVTVWFTGRTDGEGVSTDMAFTVNGDNSPRYDRCFIAGSVKNFYQSDVDLGNTGWLIDTPASADPEPLSWSVIRLEFFHYTNHLAWKIGRATEDRCSIFKNANGTLAEAWRWRSTDPIHSIAVSAGDAKILPGARMAVAVT